MDAQFPHDSHTDSIYCHFALELSKVWNYLKWKFQVYNSPNDSIKVQIDDKDFTIDLMLLNKAFSCIEIACNDVDEADAKGCNLESFSKR